MTVAKNYGVSLPDMFVHGLHRHDRRSPATVGGYEGWIRIMIQLYTTRTQLRWYYHHGGGASAMMTFGTLDIRRTASYTPDCDAYITGHTHDSYVLPVARQRLSAQGVPHQDVMWAVRVPALKQERGRDSWAVQMKHPPKPIGGVWAKIEAGSKAIRTSFVAEVE